MGTRPDADDLGRPSRTPFTVLFVCTANMCRSPMAEHLLRDVLAKNLGEDAARRWTVRSAGTNAIRGTTTHPLTTAVLNESGIPVEPSPCCQADRHDLHEADLILTAETAHRAWVVEELPSRVQRTFTIGQFARLCREGRASGPHDATVRGEDLLAVASRGRSQVQPVSIATDILDDPMGKNIEAFRRTRDILVASLEDILGVADIARSRT